jgi:hypothetical protein
LNALRGSLTAVRGILADAWGFMMVKFAMQTVENERAAEIWEIRIM